MFTRRQDVSGGSAVVLVLQKHVAQIAYPLIADGETGFVYKGS